MGKAHQRIPFHMILTEAMAISFLAHFIFVGKDLATTGYCLYKVNAETEVQLGIVLVGSFSQQLVIYP